LFMALGAQLYTRLGLANRGVAPPFTTVVTNVPGPPVPIHFTGARLESMMGLLCLTDGLGLGHVVQSYCDEATIAFTADRELLPDPDFYVKCIEDSFAELLAATQAGEPAPAKAAKLAAAAAKPKRAPAKAKTKAGAKRA
ncbi:MAG TPA: WS/DGAT domain-containing protein, partial [Erythrobacter sp.]